MTEIKTNHPINIRNGRRDLKKVSFHAESPIEKLKDKVKYALSKDGGKYIKFSNEEYGILIAAMENENTVYFVYIDKDRKICSIDASTKYSLMKEIPANCSVLQYIWNTDKLTLYHSAIDYLKNTHEMLTPIYINVKERKSHNYKKKN